MKKEVLVEISFRQLYGREPDDESDADAPFVTFYRDGTYKVDHWQEGIYSRWRIEGAIMLILHEHDKRGWVSAGEGEVTIKMVEIVACELLVDKLLTDRLGV